MWSPLDTLCVTPALHMRLSGEEHTVRHEQMFSGAACSRRVGVGARLRRLPQAPHRAVAEWTPLSLGLWSRDVAEVAASVPLQTPSRRLRTHWLRVAFAGLQPSREHAAGRSRRPDALARTSRPQATTQTGRRAVSAQERSGRSGCSCSHTKPLQTASSRAASAQPSSGSCARAPSVFLRNSSSFPSDDARNQFTASPSQSPWFSSARAAAATTTRRALGVRCSSSARAVRRVTAVSSESSSRATSRASAPAAPALAANICASATRSFQVSSVTRSSWPTSAA